MALDQLYLHITMDKSSPNKNQSSFQLFAFFHILLTLFLRFLTWVNGIHKFCSRFWSFLQSQFHSVNFCKSWDDNNNLDLQFYSHNGSLSREEVKTVMADLTLFCSPQAEELPQRLGSDELSRLFEEEPSLDEVKQAFDVFDQNKDGFIDARELQRVLCILRLKQGLKLDKCREMIQKFDENGDGRIDFKEFVKFMESSFC